MNPFLFSAGGDIGGDIYSATCGTILSSGGKFSPLSYSGLQLWMDPYDLTTITFRNVSNTIKADSQAFAQPAVLSNNPFNFLGGSSSQFCISGWFYNNVNPINDSPILGFSSCSGITGATALNWELLFAAGSANEIEFFMETPTGTFPGKAFQFIPSPVSTGQWFHLFMNYDGSKVGDDTQVLQLFINGVQYATTAGTALPQLLRNTGATSAFSIGGNFGGIYGDMRFCDVGIWAHTAGANVSAVQAAATAFWNIGTGLNFNQLPAGFTDPLAYYVGGDAQGAGLADSSGNNHPLIGLGSPLPAPIQQVTAWQDKSPNRFLFQSADGATGQQPYDGVFQVLRNRWCRYYSSYGTWGTPAVVAETGNAGLYTRALNWCGNNATGQIFVTIGETGLSVNETFELATGNDSDLIPHHELFMTGMEGPSNISPANVYAPCVRISNSTQALDYGTFINVSGSFGTYAPIVGNSYYANDGSKQYRYWGNVGSTPGQHASTGSWAIGVGGAVQVGNIDSNNQYQGWMSFFMSGANRTYIALNAFYRYCTDSSSIYNRNSVFGCTQAYGDLVVYSPCLSPAQTTKFLAWQATR